MSLIKNLRPVRDGKTVNFQGGLYYSEDFVVGENVRIFDSRNTITEIRWVSCDSADTVIRKAQLITTVDSNNNLISTGSNSLYGFVRHAISILKYDSRSTTL